MSLIRTFQNQHWDSIKQINTTKDLLKQKINKSLQRTNSLKFEKPQLQIDPTAIKIEQKIISNKNLKDKIQSISEQFCQMKKMIPTQVDSKSIKDIAKKKLEKKISFENDSQNKSTDKYLEQSPQIKSKRKKLNKCNKSSEIIDYPQNNESLQQQSNQRQSQTNLRNILHNINSRNSYDKLFKKNIIDFDQNNSMNMISKSTRIPLSFKNIQQTNISFNEQEKNQLSKQPYFTVEQECKLVAKNLEKYQQKQRQNIEMSQEQSNFIENGIQLQNNFIQLLKIQGQQYKCIQPIFDIVIDLMRDLFEYMKQNQDRQLYVINDYSKLQKKNLQIQEKNDQLHKQIKQQQKLQFQEFVQQEQSKNFKIQQYEEVLKENVKLKQTIQKQRENLIQQMKKDENIIQLLNAIRNQGVDIEQIFQEIQQSDMSEQSFSQNYYQKRNNDFDDGHDSQFDNSQFLS